jgi:outer membrane protein TolC
MTHLAATRTLRRAYALAAGLLLTASGASAQMGPPAGGGGGGGAPPAQAAPSPAAAAPSGNAQAAPAPSAQSSGPMSLYGLREVDNPETLTLDQVVHAVGAASFDLRIAQERIYQAELNVRRAWALLMPTVSAGGSYTYSFPEQEVEFFDPEQSAQQALLYESIADITEQSAGLNPDPKARAAAAEQAEELRNVAFELENADSDPIVIQPAHQLGGQAQIGMTLFNLRSLPLLQNAYDAVEITQVSTGVARDQLFFAATQAYYGAVTAKRMVSIAEKQLANAKEHRDDVGKRVELGATTPLALQRAALDVVRAEQQVRVARNGMNSALGALGLMMDRETVFDIAEPPAPPPVELNADLIGLTTRALGGRDDMLVQRIALRIAERTKTDSWAAFLPTLSLAVQGRYNSNTSGFVANPFTGAVVLNLNVPIFDGGMRYADMREADSKVREELLKLQQLRRKVESQVRGNLADISIKREALDTAKRSLTLAKDQHNSAKQLYELGAATSLQVIDASLGEFFAEIELTRAEYELAQARLGLSFVLGELPFSNGAPEPAPFSEQDESNAREVSEIPEAEADDRAPKKPTPKAPQ